MARPQKPLLLLRDYLELDSNSDSCNSFASFPRKCADSPSVRFLLEAELIRPSARPGSKTSPLSAFINAIKNFPISSPTRPRPKPRAPDESRSLSRSLSKRLGRRFSWKKTQEKKEAVVVTVNDIVRLKSFDETRRERRRTLYFPSSPPVVSSSSSCSDDAEQRSESFASSSTSSNSVDVQTQSQSQNQNLYQNPIQPSEEGANEKLECKGSQSEEEKEQLSPISVMNFPYQEEGDKNEGEEDEAISSSGFEQSLANIKRSKHRLLHKIRRFETLADLLDPLNLDLRFACTEEEADRVHVASPHAITARDLIQRLRSDLHSKPQADELLFDFFVDELSWSAGTTNENIGRLLPAAADWINGRSFINKEEHGKSQLAEMERNGRWRCFGFEKDDVAADVEMGILGSLLHELVLELADTD